ncbi:AmpG family muropeptide MFS transporter [Stigmatella sp. ncwal1]|uniref:AmpG family muropeptide MFS transporter n=1 Tax=Stigmatella ashevillensis TaxID=2995309 RepID=A0ABT5DHJ1_9BACT|nr:AmpG family muropeptide MFS transporter [Stigmatella ashevillena]MDC0713115.1 AmpG family muropeptide MFS transporter [Stigmatella ashevillena]
MSSPSVLSALRNPRVLLMFALGFSSGLPLYLTGSTLSAWMKNEGVSLKTIGVFSLVGFSYTFKFAWAPLMDRYYPPFLGRRRGWLLVTQVLLALALVVMGQVNPSSQTLLMASLAALVAFLSASQDIVADAYRTDLLSEEDRSLGVTTFTLGYRVGMIFAMAVALTLSDLIGWTSTYAVMGALMSVGVVTTLLAPEPPATHRPLTLIASVVDPLVDFFQRHRVSSPSTARQAVHSLLSKVASAIWHYRLALGTLLFIVLFRVGDAVAFRMTTPFTLELGFSNTELGVIQKFMGMAGAIAGAILGGILVVKLGIKRSLLIFGSAQALTNLLYIALAARGKDPLFLALTVGADNFTGGMGSAAMTVFITALCNRSFSATQYALLSSLSAVPMHLMGAASGFLAESLGWAGFFTFTTIAMAPALLVLLFLPRELGRTPHPEAALEQLTHPTPAPEVPAELASTAKKG